uniref:Uncharacterized protein n=1 Tax=Vespula pensylvanica TaxID=30213 RepID=A0A834U4I9_VESPE|nr:hypothetical protein H0235_011190 [Vespula pensylvanica]
MACQRVVGNSVDTEISHFRLNLAESNFTGPMCISGLMHSIPGGPNLVEARIFVGPRRKQDRNKYKGFNESRVFNFPEVVNVFVVLSALPEEKSKRLNVFERDSSCKKFMGYSTFSKFNETIVQEMLTKNCTLWGRD